MPERPAAPLIAAKKAIPPVRPGAVARARLNARLRDNARTRLTAVVAPAGWGKTTLLSQWAHDPAETRRVVWVSLDEADDEPVRFWTYVVTALRDVTAVGGGALDALTTPGLDPVDLALPVLLNEIDALDAEHVLVLDDVHLVTDRRIHEGLEFVLSYLPPSLRIVVAGRADPPLPLASLRARGELTEVRAADLGFRADEAAALLDAVGETSFDPAVAAVLCERTEGWAAGLQLAALAVRDAPDPASAAATIHGDDRHVLDYLTVEVLDRLDPGQRDLLVRTSVLERLSGELCDAVLDREGSAGVLDELDRASHFVVPLDARRAWYRCHRLFREVLLRELRSTAPAEPDRVRRRAADWYRARGFLVEAVELHLRAGDEAGAADLLRSSVPWFLERGLLAAHLSLGGRLSPAAVFGDPGLCVALAWAAGLNGEFPRMGPWLDAADPLIDAATPTLEGWRTLRGAAATVRAVHEGVVLADLPAALRLSALAVHEEDDEAVVGYVLARTIHGAMLTFGGSHDEAIPWLDDAWERAQVLGLPPVLGLQAASILALALVETGAHARLRRLFDRVGPDVRTAEQRWGASTAPGLARLRTVEGRLARVDGDVAAARGLLRRAVELAQTFGEVPALVTALFELAEVELEAGDRAAARTAAARARDVLDHEPVPQLYADRLASVERRLGRAPRTSAVRHGDVPVEELTDRERAVLRALTGDASQREIGAAMYLSVNTVKGYTKVLYRKLGVSTRQEAVTRARALGLL